MGKLTIPMALEQVDPICPNCGRALARPPLQDLIDADKVTALIVAECECGQTCHAKWYRLIVLGNGLF